MPSFVAAEIVGGALAVVVIRALYPGITPAQAADIIVPHHTSQAGPASGGADHDGASPATRPPAQPH